MAAALRNNRSGRMDLDSVYGPAEPGDNPALNKLHGLMRWPTDRAKMRLARPAPFEGGIPAAAAYLEIPDPTLEQAQEDRLRTATEVLDAQDSGNAGRYRSAVDDLRKCHAAFVAAQAASPAVRLRALGVVHARLQDVVRRPGTLTRIVAVL